MKYTPKTTLALALSAAYLSLVQPVAAQITNPAVDPTLGGNAKAASTGITFAFYFVLLWRAVITISALLLLGYLLWGAINWLTAGGDSSKVQKARDQMVNAVIGFVILIGSFSIIAFIGMIIGFDILQLTFPTP